MYNFKNRIYECSLLSTSLFLFYRNVESYLKFCSGYFSWTPLKWCPFLLKINYNTWENNSKLYYVWGIYIIHMVNLDDGIINLEEIAKRVYKTTANESYSICIAKIKRSVQHTVQAAVCSKCFDHKTSETRNLSH